jgi:hypothetical protein
MQAASFPERLKWIRIAGIVAIGGALVGMMGDYCLLYSPQGGYLDGDYGFLEGISMNRVLWGHYLGVLAIPFEAAGLYLIWLGLLPLGRKIAFGALFCRTVFDVLRGRLPWWHLSDGRCCCCWARQNGIVPPF